MVEEARSGDERSLLAIAGILDDDAGDALRKVIEERRKQRKLLSDKE